MTNSPASARSRPLSLLASPARWPPLSPYTFFFPSVLLSNIFRRSTLHRGAGQHGTGVSWGLILEFGALHDEDDMHGGEIGHAFWYLFYFCILRAGTRLARFGSVIFFSARGQQMLRQGGGEGRVTGRPWLLRLEGGGKARDSLIDDVMQLSNSPSVPDSTGRKEQQQIYEMTTTTRIWNRRRRRRQLGYLGRRQRLLNGLKTGRNKRGVPWGFRGRWGGGEGTRSWSYFGGRDRDVTPPHLAEEGLGEWMVRGLGIDRLGPAWDGRTETLMGSATPSF